MTKRAWRWFLCAAGLLASLVGLMVSSAEWKEVLDGLSSGGSSWFFEPRIVRVLRASLILAGPTLVALPLARRLVDRAARRSSPSPAAGRELPWAEVLLALALVFTGLAAARNEPPISKDGKFYLTESVEIARAGGPLALPGRLFSGAYVECNRHPFYPGVLAAVAVESDRFVDRARMFSLLGSVLGFLLVVAIARRTWNRGAGLLAGALFVTNGAVLRAGINVGCESWFMAFALAWFGFGSRPPGRHEVRNQVLAGMAAGLALVTKGTGTLLLFTSFAQLLWTRRRAALRPLLAVGGAFALTALPLLWRNATVFGNPFHNVNSSKALWLDDWSDFEDPEAMAAAGPLTYLRTHSPGEIVTRLAFGSFKEAVHVLQVFSPGSPWAGLGLPLLVLAALCLARDPGRERRLLTVILFTVFFLGFAWYAKVVQGWRFVGAIAPILFLPIARTWPDAARPGSLRALRLGVGALAVALILLGALRGALGYRLDRFTPDPAADELFAFLRENVGDRPDVHYLLGPSDSLTCDWDQRVRGHRHRFPRTEAGFAELMASNEGPRIRYAVVAAPEGGREPGCERTWYRRGPRGLEVDRPPPGWSLVRGIPADAPRILIFQRLE